MNRRQPMKPMKTPPSTSATASNGVPSTRLGRVLWMTVAIAFLALLSIGIWLWVHTHADGGHRTGLYWNEMEETSPSSAGLLAWTLTDTSPLPPSETNPAPETDPAPAKPRKDEIIYRGSENDRMEIALSFDDGPHPHYTPIILDILAEYGIHATFFMVGENVTYYPAAAEAVVAAGHEVGNHTFSHRRFSRMNEHELLDEIAACEDAISSVAECRPHFIRPPEGELNDTMRRVIGALDYRIVLWDVDTRDWAHTPPEQICTHILDTVRPGDIILMHDFIGHNSPTPEALRLVIPRLLERGYHFVTVGELVDGD